MISAYADRLHRGRSDHHVVSAVGAWLLLALAGSAATGACRIELEEALGTDVADATRLAAGLLADPHPAVSAATACWSRPGVMTQALTDWLATLPPVTERGDVPTQPAANAWARRVTHDLIHSFPLELERATVLVLATALATRFKWITPFEIVPAGPLTDCWGTEVQHVLRSTKAHRSFIADSAVGRVAVHTAGCSDGVAVVSVLAAPDAPAADVLAVAHQIALSEPSPISLFDLPVGEGHGWNISEWEETVMNPAGREERSHALLPAWHAETTIQLLTDPSLGIGAAAQALIALLPPGTYQSEAVQRTVASYTREGFEAASITAMATAVSMRHEVPTPGRIREAELRFQRPFAVVATCRHYSTRPDGSAVRGAWYGLPVFSAWITQGDEPV